MLMCSRSPWGSCSPLAWWPSSGGAKSTGEQRGTFWASQREGSQGEQPLDKAWTLDLRPLHPSTCHQWCQLLPQHLILDQQSPQWPPSPGQFLMHLNERSTTTNNNNLCLLLHHPLWYLHCLLPPGLLQWGASSTLCIIGLWPCHNGQEIFTTIYKYLWWIKISNG